jgi:Fe2+ transport system protein FeoA
MILMDTLAIQNIALENLTENISLDMIKPNESARIKEIHGGHTACKRLFELGLNRGSEVKMMKNDFGPVILYLSGHKLALGRGLAHKVIVER